MGLSLAASVMTGSLGYLSAIYCNVNATSHNQHRSHLAWTQETGWRKAIKVNSSAQAEKKEITSPEYSKSDPPGSLLLVRNTKSNVNVSCTSPGTRTEHRSLALAFTADKPTSRKHVEREIRLRPHTRAHTPRGSLFFHE
ncbi:hypothetical protein EDB86DRAFT_1278585 [Lactarius hatsudake]|nr:hypothetical protein EDB86DRAFT_1278585 [Lactarius hatsudake]